MMKSLFQNNLMVRWIIWLSLSLLCTMAQAQDDVPPASATAQSPATQEVKKETIEGDAEKPPEQPASVTAQTPASDLETNRAIPAEPTPEASAATSPTEDTKPSQSSTSPIDTASTALEPSRSQDQNITTPPAATAEEDSPPLPLIPTGSFFTRYELREGQRKIPVPSRRVGEMDAVAYRARFGLGTTPMDVAGCVKAQVQFTPQAAGFWEAGGLSDAELGLHEGYLRLLSCSLGIQVGRMEMFYGDHLIIGTVGWNQTGRSFDGLRLQIGGEPEKPFVDFLITSIAEGLNDFIPTIGAGDKYLMGVYAGIGPLLAKKTELDFYALVHLLPETELPETSLAAIEAAVGETAADLTLGSRLKLRAALVDARLEGGVQVGTRRRDPSSGGEARETLAFQIDGEVGLNFLNDKLRFAAGGLFASGDDPDTQDKIEGWDQLYPTAHKWLGLSDLIGGRSNIAGPLFHFTYSTPWDVQFAIDGHMFFRPEETLVPTENGAPTEINNGHAANEIDTGIIYFVGQGLKLRTIYALFLPDSEVYPSDDPVHFFEVELRYELK